MNTLTVLTLAVVAFAMATADPVPSPDLPVVYNFVANRNNDNNNDNRDSRGMDINELMTPVDSAIMLAIGYSPFIMVAGLLLLLAFYVVPGLASYAQK